jgi:hypothetical protein
LTSPGERMRAADLVERVVRLNLRSPGESH